MDKQMVDLGTDGVMSVEQAGQNFELTITNPEGEDTTVTLLSHELDEIVTMLISAQMS